MSGFLWSVPDNDHCFEPKTQPEPGCRFPSKRGLARHFEGGVAFEYRGVARRCASPYLLPFRGGRCRVAPQWKEIKVTLSAQELPSGATSPPWSAPHPFVPRPARSLPCPGPRRPCPAPLLHPCRSRGPRP